VEDDVVAAFESVESESRMVTEPMEERRMMNASIRLHVTSTASATGGESCLELGTGRECRVESPELTATMSFISKLK
jgi:hypothetical protein